MIFTEIGKYIDIEVIMPEMVKVNFQRGQSC
nr:MAG TPA: hypothetical protein [Caudoviricetes sp.]